VSDTIGGVATSMGTVVAPATAARRGRRRPRRLVGLVVPVVVLAAWQLAWTWEVKPPSILPSPHQVLSAADAYFFGERVATELSGVVYFRGVGWSHLATSMGRCGQAWAAAVVVGLILGLGLGLSRWVADLLSPFANALRAVPLFAWLPLLSVWFGLNSTSGRILIFIGALWPVVVATTDSVARVPAGQIETARMLGTPRTRLWRRVYLPSALPEIVTGLRLSLILAWTCVIIAELSGVTTGVGAMMTAGRESNQTDRIIVGVFVFAVVGFAADALLRLLTRRFIRWSAT